MTAGAPVVSLLPPGNIFVRFFVPEPELSLVHRGDPVALACDDCPSDLSATISFISPQAEYTPPLIYSESSKAKLVFLVEASMPVWAQWVSELLPVTHALRIVRGVLLKGDGFAEIAPDLWPIAAFTLVITVVAIWSYRETLD